VFAFALALVVLVVVVDLYSEMRIVFRH